MKSKRVLVWILDKNPQKSAQYLTNPTLIKSGLNCFQCLCNSIMYWNSIRTIYLYNNGLCRNNEVFERVFPNWCFSFKPKFKIFTSVESKWCRKCNEHFSWMLDYLNCIADELNYRHAKQPLGKNINLADVYSWFDDNKSLFNIPFAGIKKIEFPWKNLSPRFRDKDILNGYRRQFIYSFHTNDIFFEYQDSNRDVPEFVLNAYRLDI